MTYEPHHILQNQEHLEQLLKLEKLNLLYFSSSSCNVCHVFISKVLKLAKEYNIPVVEIDIQKHREVAGQTLVFTVPTLLVMHEGKEVLRESRFIDLQNVARLIEQVIA
ncbi:thioredoxin domain-containing protein [Desulfitobacterium dichloroeliminans LMG P-21439]|uniref:Thioredoxin domain-containing protein n=1 Tax=Desulfitobacterium dichloroeliminans (strain LMG P-21439 / DCA1) TaxID=871963 RepID=L0F7J0_DESDL|nr:thioredoxin family protein [Desulfitobacterium dichloroeliminans]AGA69147.1 thioredoxin domain-containing protein [Desulfitobacterium dichloroeliminans LMG P-21439]